MTIIQNARNQVNAARRLLNNPTYRPKISDSPKWNIYSTDMGYFVYETIITYESDDPNDNRSYSVPVTVESDKGMTLGEIRSAAMDVLANDEKLRSDYGITGGYFVDLDKFHLLRYYYIG